MRAVDGGFGAGDCGVYSEDFLHEWRLTSVKRRRPHPRGVRGKAESTDRGDERGTQKSQGAACGHRPARKADQETAQAVGLYAPPPGDHGVLDPCQTNRPVTEYGEETLWDGDGNAGESVNNKGKYCPARND